VIILPSYFAHGQNKNWAARINVQCTISRSYRPPRWAHQRIFRPFL
jgi:hypothetical protein